MFDKNNYYQGYWQEKCRWPECKIVLPERRWQAVYHETVEWLYNNIENCERHCRWTCDIQQEACYGLYRFRHETDLIRFTLRWT